jgi:hypothetical protein
VSVVVVVAALRSRMAACRSTVSLASAFAHVLLPDGGCRVLLIKLNPSPLRVTKCLTQVRIVIALEYSSYPGDVGHRSPEARSLTAANLASSSRCVDCMHSLTLRRWVLDLRLPDCVHNIVHTGLGDTTCPLPYLYCTLLICEVGLVGT